MKLTLRECIVNIHDDQALWALDGVMLALFTVLYYNILQIITKEHLYVFKRIIDYCKAATFTLKSYAGMEYGKMQDSYLKVIWRN